MRILFLSHTARVSGAERSLLELIDGLPDRLRPSLACPDGDLASRARKLGIPVEKVSGAELGLRLDSRRALQGLLDLTRSGVQVGGLARRERVDLIHANSLRAGMIAGLGRRRGLPIVVHARDSLPSGLLARLALRLTAARASVVVANSRHTAESLSRGSPGLRAAVVHGGVDASLFDPARFDHHESRARLGVAPGALSLGVVGQITPWKGQSDAIAAVSELKNAGAGCELTVVGSPKFVDATTRFDNPGYLRELKAMTARLGLQPMVRFLGEQDDVPQILAGLEVLLVPSWAEPFGRIVLEGMAMGLPVVATEVGGPREVIADGESGFLVPPRRPELLAARVLELQEDEGLRRRIGQRARSHVVEHFSQAGHIRGVMNTWAQILGRPV